MIFEAQNVDCALIACHLRHLVQLRIVAKDLDAVLRHGVDVADLRQEPIDPMIDHFGHSPGIGRYRNDLAGHGLQRGQAERLQGCWA